MAKKKFSETVLGKILAGKGIKKDKAKATSSSSEGSFKSAFAAARKAQGAGGTFTWKGNKYNTNLASESKTTNKNADKVQEILKTKNKNTIPAGSEDARKKAVESSAKGKVTVGKSKGGRGTEQKQKFDSSGNPVAGASPYGEGRRKFYEEASKTRQRTFTKEKEAAVKAAGGKGRGDGFGQAWAEKERSVRAMPKVEGDRFVSASIKNTLNDSPEVIAKLKRYTKKQYEGMTPDQRESVGLPRGLTAYDKDKYFAKSGGKYTGVTESGKVLKEKNFTGIPTQSTYSLSESRAAQKAGEEAYKAGGKYSKGGMATKNRIGANDLRKSGSVISSVDRRKKPEGK
jgi:hypothetical protein